ncbi:uncharacterized protein LOC144648356 [Oculina patagonica]
MDEDDNICEEQLSDSFCVEEADNVERQCHFQANCGANLSCHEPGVLEFELQPYINQISRRHGVREQHFNTRIQQRGGFIPAENITTAIRDGLHRAIGQVLQLLEPGDSDRDRLYVNLASNRISNSYHGWAGRIGTFRQNGAGLDAIVQRLQNMLNSNQQFEMDDSFQLSITRARAAPQGRGKPEQVKAGHQNIQSLRINKRSIIQIKNHDNLCCARAIVTAKAKVEQHPQYSSFRHGGKIQERAAQELHEEAGVPLGPCGYEELKAFAQTNSLKDYELLMVDSRLNYRVTSFSSDSSDKRIILLYGGEHYDVITSLPGVFTSSYFCYKCHKPYKCLNQHKCSKAVLCRCCLQEGCPDFLLALQRRQQASIPCAACNRLFFGTTCFEAHRFKNYQNKAEPVLSKTICGTRRRCRTCHKLNVGWEEIKEHVCYFDECPSCKKTVDLRDHKCFIQRLKTPAEQLEEANEKRKKRKRGRSKNKSRKRGTASHDPEPESNEDYQERPPILVFFDIESMQSKEQHEPNLLIAQREDEDTMYRFEGPDCVKQFLEWLETLTEKGEQPLTVIAHNFQGYDSHFCLKEYRKQGRIVERILNGAKVLQLTVNVIRFIDSLFFFQMPLSAFPKTFGITELKKGHFPHLFNTPEHQEYVGEMPAIDYYTPQHMSVKGRREFQEWYDRQKQKNQPFDFRQELRAYCESDVKLLKEGCLTFKTLFEKISGFDPFTKMTIASACNADFRMNRMIEGSLANEPLMGWRCQMNQSHVALEWLYWEEEQLRRAERAAMSEEDLMAEDLMTLAYPEDFPTVRSDRIQHTRNQGEFLVPNTRYHVDGYDAVTGTLYEFHGCYYHSCPDCFPHREEIHSRHIGVTMRDVYQRTLKKMVYLERQGYVVKQMWECSWKRMKQENEEIADFVRCLDLQPPLQPRDAFFGGRTNAIKLYHQVEEGEEIRYIDFTSLYPFVNKTKEYPVGHPIFISSPSMDDWSQYFGLVRCTLLPPYNLYHPVLPYRCQGKLVFPLCKTCAEAEMVKPLVERSYWCRHSPQERQLTGTWCTPEVQKALEMGYEMEASGWPEHVGNDEAKRQQYLRDYYEREGIQLEYHKIHYNPGLRALAKMMLNSFWGKFVQRPNKTQVRQFSDPVEFHRHLETDAYEVQQVSVLSDDIVEVQYKHNENDVPLSPNLNIFVACFTTCHARLHLYESLQKLKERVLYMDTDSLIYLHRPSQYNPSLGDYLRDFTNELDPGDYITEFASAGAKNYGYLTKNGKKECKVRGFKLNCEGQQQLNYDALRENVVKEIQQPLAKPREHQIINSFHIVRDAKTSDVFTFPQYKSYKIVFDKRVVDPVTFQSFPYGYAGAN